MMEEVPVVIVGAGPSGLAMGLSLAKYEIKVGFSIEVQTHRNRVDQKASL